MAMGAISHSDYKMICFHRNNRNNNDRTLTEIDYASIEKTNKINKMP
jgi:hypothetical protein